MVRCLVTLTDL